MLSSLTITGSYAYRYICLLILVFYTLTHSEFVYARWATYEDAAVETEFYNITINVNKDGSDTTIYEFKDKILKESGRQWFSSVRLYYNGDSEQIKIVEAKTINNGKEFKLAPKMIEDKPLASSLQGFDQTRQILLSFPNIEVGSSIYLKYEYKKNVPSFDKFFSKMLIPASDSILKNYQVSVNSKIPLHILTNDPNNCLKVVETKNDDSTTFKINIVKPLHQELVNEPDDSSINHKHYTWVSISSLTKWEDLSSLIAPGYEKVLNQPLPKEFELIKEVAAKEKNDTDKINKVTSLLNEKIRFMGDWNSVKGRFLPHDLDQVVKAQFGDCKDFSTSTGAILKQLGFKVQSAIVLRGRKEQSYIGTLPDISNFNHAIIKVTNKDGKVYWVDPTNDTSMADGIFPDIAGKMSLVLDSQKGSYDKIDNVDPNHAKSEVREELTIKNNTLIYNGTFDLYGEKAIMLAGASLYASEQHIKDLMFYDLSGTSLDEQEKIDMRLPDLTSRIVTKMRIPYSYQQNALIRTNLGSAIKPGSTYASEIVNVSDNQVSDIYLGMPRTTKNHLIIKGIKVQDIAHLNYETDTPWVYLKRYCLHNGNDTEIIDTAIIKTRFIPSAEIKKATYKKLRSEVELNFRGTIVVLEPEKY